MSFTIDDGRGRGFRASVSEKHRLNISSKTARRVFYISRDDKRAFSVTSIDGGAASGDFILYLKNTSTTRFMYIDDVHVSAVNAAVWKLWSVTGTAASSSALTPSNLNLSSGITAEATARGDGAVADLTTDRLITAKRNIATGGEDMDIKSALVVGPNDAVAIEYDTGTSGLAETSIDFWYEDIDRAN